MSRKKARTLGKVVKDTVDFIYSYLSPFPDGMTMNARQLGRVEARICSNLVDRGILSKTKRGTGSREYRYKWEATMGPTKVLIESITQQLSDQNKAYMEKCKNKSKQKDMKENITAPSVRVDEAPEPVVEEVKEEKTITGLDMFSAQELWNELKNRGYFIQGDKLAFMIIDYLD